MDGNPMNMADIRQAFRTPVRILLPKLLKSRDAWKAKSDRRKAQLKAAKIKIRDCSASREMWRQRAEQLAQENRQLREQFEHAEHEPTQMQAPFAELDAKKK
jgi:hypothetical protein